MGTFETAYLFYHIASFAINHIPEIEEQIMPSGWDATDSQVETIMNLAKKRFKLETA